MCNNELNSESRNKSDTSLTELIKHSVPSSPYPSENQRSGHYDNSRLLNIHRSSDHPEVDAFIDRLWDTGFAQKFPKRRGNQPKAMPKAQFKVLILDLYAAWIQDPTLKLSVGLAKGNFKTTSKYNALNISYIMRSLVHAAHDEGYITLRVGIHHNSISRIWPSRKLADLFKNVRFTPDDIAISDEVEVIILNGKKSDNNSKSKRIEYSDTDCAEIPQMRQDLQAYNALLKNAIIDIGPINTPISQHNKFVERIFYRGKWELGGRFHGGWWQQIGSNDRRGIRINGQSTCEVDFSGFHVSLIYCLERQPPPADPYTLSSLDTDYNPRELRNAVKGLVLCAINAKSRTSAYQGFRDDQEPGTMWKLFSNSELAIILDAFVTENPVVKNYICKDKGVELMKLDGDITAIIINHFTEKNVPMLTVHDSYIVPDDKVDELHHVMHEAVDKVVGDYGVYVTRDGRSYALSEASGVSKLVH